MRLAGDCSGQMGMIRRAGCSHPARLSAFYGCGDMAQSILRHPRRQMFPTVLAAGAAVGVVAILVFLPWPLGGVQDWCHAVAALVLAGCSVLAAAAVLRGESSAFGFTIIPVVPVLLLALFARAQLAGGLEPISRGGSVWWPQTVYPAQTREALADLVTAVSAVLIGSAVFFDGSRFRILLIACLGSAAAVALLGIGTRLTGDDYLVRGAVTSGSPFAAFVNRNNAAAYLQIGIASGLCLLRLITTRDASESDLDHGSAGPPFGRFHVWVDRPTALIIVTALTGLCMAGVIASRSRGGILAAAVTLVVGAASFRSLGVRVSTIASLSLLAAAATLVAWLGVAGAALERFSTLSLDGISNEVRVQHWRDAARAFAARPVWGGGAGAYGYAYEEFAKHPFEKWFRHADGQYVELLVESGLAGAAAVLIGLGLAAYGWRRGRERLAERTLLFCLVGGQGVQAVSDFGIVIPSVTLSAAALWGACLARLLDRASAVGVRAKWPMIVSLAAASAATFWASAEHRRAWAVDEYARPATVALARGDRPGVEWASRSLIGLRSALASRPDDAEGWRAAGDLEVYLYRAAAGAQVGELDATLSETQAWQATSLGALHAAANILARSGATGGLAALRDDPLVRERLVPARRDFEAAAAACPRLQGVWLSLACLQFSDGEQTPGGIPEISTAVDLFPARPSTLKLAGRLSWQAGDSALAGRCWRRAFSFAPDDYWVYVAELASEAGPPDAVRLTLPEELEAAVWIADTAPSDGAADLRQAAGERLSGLAESRADGTLSVRAGAAAARLLGDTVRAEAILRNSLAEHPADAAARAELARTLWDSGRRPEALEELRLAITLAPGSEVLRRLEALWKRNTSESAAHSGSTAR